MRQLAFFAALIGLLAWLHQSGHTKIVDGDTIRIGSERVRLTDYDAPELFSPRCKHEKRLAELARDRLQAILPQLSLEFVPCATGNYGRACARATLGGKPLADLMIREGLAAPYLCSEHRCPPHRNWCG